MSCRVIDLSHKKVDKKRDVERTQGSFIRRACALLTTLLPGIGATPKSTAATKTVSRLGAIFATCPILKTNDGGANWNAQLPGTSRYIWGVHLVKPCTNKTLLETVQLALQGYVAVGG